MINIVRARRKLLPWWMKFFIWFFMISTVFTCVSIAFASIGITIYFGFPPSDTSSIYGLESNDIYSPLGFLINLLVIFKGVTGFGMWTGKDWAINFGIVDALLGIGICLVVTMVYPFIDAGMLNLRLEILVLVPYLIKCLKLRNKWKYLSPVHQFTINDFGQTAFLANSQVEDYKESNIVVNDQENEETHDSNEDVDKIDKEDHRKFMPKDLGEVN